MYGLNVNELPKLTRPDLERVQKDLKIYLAQIDSALATLHPKRHAAAKICLRESREILRQAQAEIKRLLDAGGQPPDMRS